MTKEEFLEYNKRCAEFLGFKYKNQAKFWAIYPLDNNSYLRQLGYVKMDNLQFHSDWNWIMEVIEAVSALEKDYPIGTDNVLSLSINTDKEEVVQAINQFLIWYNEIQVNKH